LPDETTYRNDIDAAVEMRVVDDTPHALEEITR
jgi:hypothetical protein